MIRRWIFFIATLLAAALLGCGDDDGGPTEPSNEPPDAVADLAMIANDDYAITLTWSAPADPAKQMTVSAYDLRYSTAMITEENWADADTVAGEPVPGEAVSDTFTVDGLQFATTYYFALKSLDDDDEWSDLSNVLQAMTDSVDNRLIAYYPLIDNTEDATGKNDPMNLLRVIFDEGSIYCNGHYADGIDTLGSQAWTPNLPEMDLDSLTISVMFKPDGYYHDHRRPVFMAGSGWRWLGIRLQTNGTLSLVYNNLHQVQTSVIYQLDTWHEGVVTYDGSTAILYLDGVQIASKSDLVLEHHDRRNVYTTHGGAGNAYKGHLKMLKVYKGVVPPQ